MSRYSEIDPSWGPLDASPIHFVGIGGAGMSVIAQMYSAMGAKVSGSDARESDVTKTLRSSGISVSVPQAGANVGGQKTVVLSSAIRDSNPELLTAQASGALIIHRSTALALLMRGRRAVAVAGAHGKTTTSAMIAVASKHVGLDPSFAIGGSVRTPNGHISGGAVGTSDVLVAEADESDGSFLNYEPYIAVVTNVEPDHLDHYGSREAFEQAFVEFAAKVDPRGALVACADDEGAFKLARAASLRGTPVVTYGTLAGSDVLLTNVQQVAGQDGISFTLSWDPSRFASEASTANVSLQVPGMHNALNAAAAFTTLAQLGASPAEIAAGLEQFLGTGRRFELKGTGAGVRVIDDYAHHPTEVAALLTAARVAADSGRVIAVFQPHLYSRTRIFAAEFAAAFELADHTILSAIYAAREDHDPDTSSTMIADLMSKPAEYVADMWDAGARAAEIAEPGDLILTIGAGDITEIGPAIVDALAARG